MVSPNLIPSSLRLQTHMLLAHFPSLSLLPKDLETQKAKIRAELRAIYWEKQWDKKLNRNISTNTNNESVQREGAKCSLNLGQWWTDPMPITIDFLTRKSHLLGRESLFCAPGNGERYYQTVFVSWPCYTAPGFIPSQVLWKINRVFFWN